MFLIDILKSVFNALCSSSESKPAPPQVQHQHQHQPTSHSPNYPHKPQKHSGLQPHQDLNQINQSNEGYIGLRARANEEGDQMAKCFEQSHQAYARGNGAEAKALSNQGKEHQQKMESLNRQASDWIYLENNKDSKAGEIDLHGLYVKEAISRTDGAIEDAKQRGDSEIRLIVGKGLHSKGGSAKIKPAIEELMQKHQLVAQLDPNNSGILIVRINSEENRGVGPDEITRRLERTDESCTIM